jgi:hypothetical protein
MVCREVIAELKAAGATWIQFDEPTLVKDLESHQLAAFSAAYAELESALSGLNVLVETYFADVPAASYKYAWFLWQFIIFIPSVPLIYFCRDNTLTVLLLLQDSNIIEQCDCLWI